MALGDRLRELLGMTSRTEGKTQGMGMKNNVSGPARGPRPFSSANFSIAFEVNEDPGTLSEDVDINNLENQMEDNEDIDITTNVSIRPGRFESPAEIVVDTRASIIFDQALANIETEVNVHGHTTTGYYIATV